ncbi:hypothetical protein [Halomicronema sp. CCY15110]|uniref:hypothetical protein n=1 Tax=Halomicronema sp. CCY15110 TaxID=2767773 RepID=UPI00194EBE6A|nr:hypothetical protein [Halomicronema sp. CCY15110]
MQQVIWQGVELLGLVRSEKANRYVSTLWLQSGIPRQSLEHFADLIQSLDYDWWDMAHADPVDLAQLLCDVCEQKFPQRGKLQTFLKSSCPEDHEEDIDPISGNLLQGLATVAHELERRGESPECLQDENQRNRILQHYSLPSTFFLRSWDSLIRVLTPRPKPSPQRSIVSFRKKPLSLRLDLEDTFDIQLALPAQQVYRKDWKTLQAGYCQIPEAQWEGDIDFGRRTLEIPELHQTVTEATDQWTWQLRSHNQQVLWEWHHDGLQPDQLCLIFDAETGDVRSPQQLALSSEIILFTPESVQRQYSDGLEIIDNFVPCSLSGWRGHWLQRTGVNASIQLTQGHQKQALSWLTAPQQPQLQGAKLKGRQPTFLDTPTLWYPPLPIGKTLNLLIEDMDQREILTEPNQQISLPPQSGWLAVDLSPWITQPGTYSVRLWTTASNWCTKFSIKQIFQLQKDNLSRSIEVKNQQGISIEFPYHSQGSHDFWLSTLTFRNLWPLEERQFLLSNTKQEIVFTKNASSSGDMQFDLACLRDSVPEGDGYTLDYFSLSQEREEKAGDTSDEAQEANPIEKNQYYLVRSKEHKARFVRQMIEHKINFRNWEKFLKCAIQCGDVSIKCEASKSDCLSDIKWICLSLKKELGMQLQIISQN